MEPAEHKPPFLSQLRPNDIHPITGTRSNHFRRMQREFIYTSHFDPSEMPLRVTRVNCFPGSEFRIAKCFSMLVFKEGSEGSYNMFRTPMAGLAWGGGGEFHEPVKQYMSLTGGNVWPATLLHTHHVSFALRARLFHFFHISTEITGAVFCSAELDKHFHKLNKAPRWTCLKSVMI